MKYNNNSLRLMKGEKEKLTASFKPDLDIRSNLLFIYTDLIRDHFVGDTSSQLLRVVPLSKGEYETIEHVSFSNPYYYKIRSNHVESISVLLCDETGQQLEFKSGRVYMNLHFKKSI